MLNSIESCRLLFWNLVFFCSGIWSVLMPHLLLIPGAGSRDQIPCPKSPEGLYSSSYRRTPTYARKTAKEITVLQKQLKHLSAFFGALLLVSFTWESNCNHIFGNNYLRVQHKPQLSLSSAYNFLHLRFRLPTAEGRRCLLAVL